MYPNTVSAETLSKYRGASLIRNCPTPQDHHKGLGIDTHSPTCPLLALCSCTRTPCLPRGEKFFVGDPERNCKGQFCMSEVRLYQSPEKIFSEDHRKVDGRLPEKGSSNFHGARPVHLIITMKEWIRTSSLSTKNSLSLSLHVIGLQFLREEVLRIKRF
jgi:hypothetical protein